MPTTGVGNLLMPQYLMPDFDKQATTDFTAVMNLAKQAAQMQAARNRLALAQARASRGGSVKLTKEERQQAAKKATEDAVRKFVEGDAELKKNYSIVTDPTKTAREVEDALKYIRGREPAIRAQLGTDASKSYDALFGSIKTQADKQVSARNKYGITDALATGYALGKEDISGAFRQLLAIGDAEERARIGRETAAAKQAIQQRDPYMADVAKGGASNSLYDVASGVSSMATSTLPILGAGVVGTMAAPVAGPIAASGLTLAGAMGYGAGLGQSAAAERIVNEPGLTEAQQAEAIDKAMPLVSGAGVLTSLPLARPVGKLVTRAITNRAAGAAAEQAAASAAGKTLGFAARHPFIASTAEAAGEGALGMGLSTIAENAAVNAALNKPLNLTENLGEAVGAGLAVSPLFGALGMRRTARQTTPTKPDSTVTTSSKSTGDAVNNLRNQLASLKEGDDTTAVTDALRGLSSVTNKDVRTTNVPLLRDLQTMLSGASGDTDLVATAQMLVARDKIFDWIKKTPANKEGLYGKKKQKELNDLIADYAAKGGSMEELSGLTQNWTELTARPRLTAPQATAYDNFMAANRDTHDQLFGRTPETPEIPPVINPENAQTESTVQLEQPSASVAEQPKYTTEQAWKWFDIAKNLTVGDAKLSTKSNLAALRSMAKKQNELPAFNAFFAEHKGDLTDVLNGKRNPEDILGERPAARVEPDVQPRAEGTDEKLNGAYSELGGSTEANAPVTPPVSPEQTINASAATESRRTSGTPLSRKRPTKKNEDATPEAGSDTSAARESNGQLSEQSALTDEVSDQKPGEPASTADRADGDSGNVATANADTSGKKSAITPDEAKKAAADLKLGYIPVSEDAVDVFTKVAMNIMNKATGTKRPVGKKETGPKLNAEQRRRIKVQTDYFQTRQQELAYKLALRKVGVFFDGKATIAGSKVNDKITGPQMSLGSVESYQTYIPREAEAAKALKVEPVKLTEEQLEYAQNFAGDNFSREFRGTSHGSDWENALIKDLEKLEPERTVIEEAGDGNNVLPEDPTIKAEAQATNAKNVSGVTDTSGREVLKQDNGQATVIIYRRNRGKCQG